ncbi:hypothetical protein D3C75_717950 [compost metagenome]
MFCIRNNLFRCCNLLFGQCTQHFLQMPILIRVVLNEHFLHKGWIDNIVFSFLKSNPGSHDNLFYSEVVHYNRVVVQNFFDFHVILLCFFVPKAWRSSTPRTQVTTKAVAAASRNPII